MTKTERIATLSLICALNNIVTELKGYGKDFSSRHITAEGEGLERVVEEFRKEVKL